jgi:hypothetical protein
MTMRFVAWIAIAAGCASGAAVRAPVATLRPACGDEQPWDGHACRTIRDAVHALDTAIAALAKLQVDDAKAALDAAEHAGPLDHPHHVTLWEQRGIAAAYLDDEAGATAAFDMLLAIDPGHFLSYKTSPKATFVFEQVRARKDRVPPELDVTWPRGGKVGEPVPLDVEVLADPKRFLHRATVFVRTHGEASWRATDLPLVGKGEQRVLLPPVAASKPISLDVYAKAYDDRGNEVLLWADPSRPREIPLRYDPPAPWYKTWWGISAIGGAVAAVAGLTVYEVTLAPPDKVGGTVRVQ